METQAQKPRYRMKVVKDWNTFDENSTKIIKMFEGILKMINELVDDLKKSDEQASE